MGTLPPPLSDAFSTTHHTVSHNSSTTTLTLSSTRRPRPPSIMTPSSTTEDASVLHTPPRPLLPLPLLLTQTVFRPAPLRLRGPRTTLFLSPPITMMKILLLTLSNQPTDLFHRRGYLSQETSGAALGTPKHCSPEAGVSRTIKCTRPDPCLPPTTLWRSKGHTVPRGALGCYVFHIDASHSTPTTTAPVQRVCASGLNNHYYDNSIPRLLTHG